MLDAVTQIGQIGSKIIDKIWPDETSKNEAKAKLLKLQQEGQLQELEAKYNAIIAEAKSADAWVSRARPSFLYVIYILILAAIPMGVLYAANPIFANNLTLGVKNWLEAIPGDLYALFAAGYLGYTGARSFDKKKNIEAIKK